MTMTLGDISHVRPMPYLPGMWHGALPKIELPIRRPASQPPPFRIRIPMLPAYNLLAMSAGTDKQDISLSSADSSAATAGARGRSERANPGSSKARQSADPKQAEANPDDLHDMVVEHGDAIFRLALSVVRDKALAEDVAQEALVKAWLALPSFRGDASLRSWILRITHNTAISTLRRRRAVVIDPHDFPEQQTRVERSVESKVQGEVVMDQFVEALDTLDELSRSIVVLRELEGLSYDEISDLLDVPMPTVKTRLLRARRRLGNVLREWA